MLTLSFAGAWNGTPTYFLWIKPSRPIGMKSFLLLAHLKTVLRRNLIQDVDDTPSFPKMERSLSGVCIFLYESLMPLLTYGFFFFLAR